jgi:DNA-binding MarR family transcriptional regulator
MRSASATVLVNRLESAGDVSRYPDPADGRRIVPRLTDSARTEFVVEERCRQDRACRSRLVAGQDGRDVVRRW